MSKPPVSPTFYCDSTIALVDVLTHICDHTQAPTDREAWEQYATKKLLPGLVVRVGALERVAQVAHDVVHGGVNPAKPDETYRVLVRLEAALCELAAVPSLPMPSVPPTPSETEKSTK